MSGLESCRIVPLPQISDRRGNLSFVEADEHIPFSIRRVYYLYDVPGGADRGSHAHKRLQQFVIALGGSFDITLDDGSGEQTFQLNRAHFGLYICPLIWRRLDNFSSGAVCLVLASEHYEEDDYIRSYPDFLAARGCAL